MKNKFKWGGLLALVGFLGLAGSASATPITFSFTNIGTVDNVSSCGFGCSSMQTSGDLYVDGFLAGTFAGTMKVLGFIDSDVASSSSWSFLDSSGLNSLNGGTGLFSGSTGHGESDFLFAGNQYGESGWLTVNTGATSVPEPAVSTLLLVGFGMVGFLAYRRRRASTQI
jgi:hypothetical protein